MEGYVCELRDVEEARGMRRVLKYCFVSGHVAAEPMKMAVSPVSRHHLLRSSSDFFLSICMSHTHRTVLLEKSWRFRARRQLHMPVRSSGLDLF